MPDAFLAIININKGTFPLQHDNEGKVSEGLLCGVQIWFDLYRPPSGREADLLEEVLASWFMLGRLGAYNAQNLQVRSI